MVRTVVISLVLAGASAAAVADTYGEPAYVPPQKHVAGVQLEWVPAGGITYSGNAGELDGDLAMTAAVSGWVGWEFTDGIELGVETRFVPNERIVFSDGSTDTSTGNELVVAAPLRFHGRWWRQLDVAFVLAPGYSHVFVPDTTNLFSDRTQLPDAGGFTIDFAGEAMYPLSGRVLGVVSFGYQRGFQRTHERVGGLIQQDMTTAWATDYTHIGLGVATRF